MMLSESPWETLIRNMSVFQNPAFHNSYHWDLLLVMSVTVKDDVVSLILWKICSENQHLLDSSPAPSHISFPLSFPFKKETWHNMHELGRHSVKWNELGTKEICCMIHRNTHIHMIHRNILHDSTSMRCLEESNHRDREWNGGGQEPGEGKWGVVYRNRILYIWKWLKLEILLQYMYTLFHKNFHK